MKIWSCLILTVVLMAASPRSEAKEVKFCINLTGALANARAHIQAALEQPVSEENAKLSATYCDSSDAADGLRIIKKGQLTFLDNNGVERKLQAHIWFDDYSTPILVKYHRADAFLNGKPTALYFVYREEIPVSEAEYEAAIKCYRQNAPVLTAPLFQ